MSAFDGEDEEELRKAEELVHLCVWVALSLCRLFVCWDLARELLIL